jgi:biotin transport system substrate-specific component
VSTPVEGTASRLPLARAPAARWAAGIVGFAVLTALGARVAVPLPGTPVPFTFQVLAVLLAGYLLGPTAGAASQALYLAAGAAGLPVFAAGGGAAYLLGPTGGYLMAFPLAAALVGVATTRRSGPAWHAAGLAAGVAAIYLGGAAWLGLVTDHEAAFAAGVAPFLLADALKAALALAIGRSVSAPARRFFGA